MKGLIIKDFINLRGQIKIVASILIIYTVVCMWTTAPAQRGDLITMLMSLFCVMLPIASFAYDEIVHWDRYALAMSLSRWDLVLSKYIVSWVVIAVFLLLSCVVQAFGGNDWGVIVATLCLQGGMALWFIAIILPLLFRFGAEKGRMMLVLVFALVFFFLFFWEKVVGLPAQVSIQSLIWILPASAILGEGLSVWCSFRIYQRKEIQ